MMKIDLNIHQLNKLLKRRDGDRFKLIYKFTTENISGYIKEFDFKNKSRKQTSKQLYMLVLHILA